MRLNFFQRRNVCKFEMKARKREVSRSAAHHRQSRETYFPCFVACEENTAALPLPDTETLSKQSSRRIKGEWLAVAGEAEPQRPVHCFRLLNLVRDRLRNARFDPLAACPILIYERRIAELQRIKRWRKWNSEIKGRK